MKKRAGYFFLQLEPEEEEDKRTVHINVYDSEISQGNVLEGVSVTLDGTTILTDGNGTATFNEVLDGTYYISLEKEDYKSLSDTIIVSEASTIFNYILEKDEPIPAVTSVTIGVYDENENPLPDSTVRLDDEVHTTGEFGITIFDNITYEEHQLSISKDGYLSVTETINVTEDTAGLSYYLEKQIILRDVIIHTVNTAGTALNDVAITINDVTKSTTDGHVTFQLEDGDYTVHAEKTDYNNLDMQISVTATETVFTCRLSKKTKNITFSVKDSTSETGIPNVDVRVVEMPDKTPEYTSTTDSEGNSVFSLSKGYYVIYTTHADYVDSETRVTVDDNTESFDIFIVEKEKRFDCTFYTRDLYGNLVDGAFVEVGDSRGTTNNGELVLHDILEGEHLVNITKDGYKDFITTITVDHESTSFTFNLTRFATVRYRLYDRVDTSAPLEGAKITIQDEYVGYTDANGEAAIQCRRPENPGSERVKVMIESENHETIIEDSLTNIATLTRYMRHKFSYSLYIMGNDIALKKGMKVYQKAIYGYYDNHVYTIPEAVDGEWYYEDTVELYCNNMSATFYALEGRGEGMLESENSYTVYEPESYPEVTFLVNAMPVVVNVYDGDTRPAYEIIINDPLTDESQTYEVAADTTFQCYDFLVGHDLQAIIIPTGGSPHPVILEYNKDKQDNDIYI